MVKVLTATFVIVNVCFESSAAGRDSRCLFRLGNLLS